MKIDRIKKSLGACGVYHVVTSLGQVYCAWWIGDRRYWAYYDSYGAAYRELKNVGVLTKERYLLYRYG